jgi:transposase
MQKLSPQPVPTETQIAALSPVEIRGILQSQAQTIDALKHQLEWLKRQMFGTKSERLAVLENAQQLPLAELAPFLQPAVAKVQSIAAHTRRAFSEWKTHFAGNPLRSGLHTLTR